MPMWGVEVFQRRVNFGEDCSVTLMVEVGAAEKPNPVPMTPVVFEGLEVSIFPNKAGGLSALVGRGDRGHPAAPGPEDRRHPRASSTSGSDKDAARRRTSSNSSRSSAAA